MTTLNYTQSAEDLDSSAVEKAYYDGNDSTLTVVLPGGVYTYDGVPAQEFTALVNAPSIGRHYANNIKPNYGPGEYQGREGAVRFVPSVPTLATGSFTGRAAAVGTPKGLTLAPDATVTNVTNTVQRFALSAPGEEVPSHVVYDYTVYFITEDGSPREYNTQGGSHFHDVVDGLHEIGDMLGQTFEVTDVTIHLG